MAASSDSSDEDMEKFAAIAGIVDSGNTFLGCVRFYKG